MDAGETAEEAIDLGSGSYRGYMLDDDDEDRYKLTIEKGQIVRLTLNYPAELGINAYLKNATGNTIASAVISTGREKILEYVAGKGEHYLLFKRSSVYGEYAFNIEIENQNDAGSGGDAGDDFSTASLIQEGSLTGFLLARDSSDWYGLSVFKGQIVNLAITAAPGLDVSLALLNSNSNIVAYATAPEGQEKKLDYCANTTDFWFIRINRNSGSGQYTLKIQLQNQNDAGSGGDAGEIVEEAISIQQGTIDGFLKNSDDEDWYYFSPSIDDTIILNVDVPEDARFTMSLKDFDGQTLKTSSNSTGQDQHIEFSTRSGRGNYVRINRTEGEGYYSLQLMLLHQNDAGSGGDAGDTRDEATALPLATVFTSSTITGYLLDRDNDDWYALGMLPVGNINVQLDHEGTGDFTLYLYNAQGNVVATTSGTEPKEFSHSVTAAGLNWFMRVGRNSGYGSYTLNISRSNM